MIDCLKTGPDLVSKLLRTSIRVSTHHYGDEQVIEAGVRSFFCESREDPQWSPFLGSIGVACPFQMIHRVAISDWIATVKHA